VPVTSATLIDDGAELPVPLASAMSPRNALEA
jgi:hypothetical protein